MRVTHVIPSFYPAYVYGGPIESVYQLCRSLVGTGCEVRVLTTDANGPDRALHVEKNREVELGRGLRVRYCQRYMCHSVSLNLLRLLPAYVRWADVVHLTAVYSFPTIPTLLTCRVLGKPVVWSPRGALQRWDGSTRPQLKAIWERLCRIVAPRKFILHVTSAEEASASQKRMQGVEATVIPNGVEIAEQMTYIPGNGTLRLLYLGRLHPKKGIENLLTACHRLSNGSSIDWTLTIAGAGDRPYTETLRARIAELGIRSQAQIVGEVVGHSKQLLFENTDIVVIPSYTENFGMVVAEALAHGVPVISSTGTPWKSVEDIGCGFWVDNGPETLAEAIVRMSRMPLREMGQRGREWMRKEFAWPSVAEKMVQNYHKLLGCLP